MIIVIIRVNQKYAAYNVLIQSQKNIFSSNKNVCEKKILIFIPLSLIVSNVIADSIPADTWSGEILVNSNEVPIKAGLYKNLQ